MLDFGEQVLRNALLRGSTARRCTIAIVLVQKITREIVQSTKQFIPDARYFFTLGYTANPAVRTRISTSRATRQRTGARVGLRRSRRHAQPLDRWGVRLRPDIGGYLDVYGRLNGHEAEESLPPVGNCSFAGPSGRLGAYLPVAWGDRVGAHAMELLAHVSAFYRSLSRLHYQRGAAHRGTLVVGRRTGIPVVRPLYLVSGRPPRGCRRPRSGSWDLTCSSRRSSYKRSRPARSFFPAAAGVISLSVS